MIDSVEGLREIDNHRHCPAGWTFLVETCYHLLSKWQQSSDSGSARSITVLGFSQWQMRADASVHQFLEDFGGWAQDRYGTIGRTLIFGFAGFEDGENNRMLPYCWEICPLIREVEQIGEVSYSQWPQVFQLVNGETICTWGS